MLQKTTGFIEHITGQGNSQNDRQGKEVEAGDIETLMKPRGFNRLTKDRPWVLIAVERITSPHPCVSSETYLDLLMPIESLVYG